MQDWRRTVGSNIRRLRQAKKLTQEALAFRAKIDTTYLRGIEAGRRNPSLMVMVRLATALGARPTDLLKSV
jgi:transcriptional regulator with XRE-family HTH domain